jgi:hypothetical protein
LALFLPPFWGFHHRDVDSDLADRVKGALTAGLPDNGFELVNEVDVRRGWGDVYFVDVHSGLRHTDAHPKLKGMVHTVVDSVMPDVRHSVKIVWASGSSN